MRENASEACGRPNQTMLFTWGIAQPPARSTLADALNLRDWRICDPGGRVLR